MTPAELNRDIKRLAQRYKKAHALPNDQYFLISKELKAEAQRLYQCDKKLEYMNARSLRIMISLNRILQFEAYHTFGPQFHEL